MGTKIDFIPHEELRENFPQLKMLLAHKPPAAIWLLEEVLKLSPKNDLRMDSIIATEGKQWIGNINIFHYRGIGLVGNVFLEERFRGHGLGSEMMKAIEDWACRENHKIHVLWVDPQKRPAAYSMYRKHGYTTYPESGIMLRPFEWTDIYETPSQVRWVPLQWKHYPQINLLTSMGLCETLASYLHSCYGNATFESEFLKCMQDETESCFALENEAGYAVGAAFLKKDWLWEQQREANYQNPNYLFDVLIESRHASQLGAALSKFAWPKGRIATYAQDPSEKFSALKATFTPSLDLKHQFMWKNKFEDVSVMFKEQN